MLWTLLNVAEGALSVQLDPPTESYGARVRRIEQQSRARGWDAQTAVNRYFRQVFVGQAVYTISSLSAIALVCVGAGLQWPALLLYGLALTPLLLKLLAWAGKRSLSRKLYVNKEYLNGH